MFVSSKVLNGLKIVDILGRDRNTKNNTLLFYIYNKWNSREKNDIKMKKTIVTLLCLCFILASCTTSKNCNKGLRIKTEMGTIKKH